LTGAFFEGALATGLETFLAGDFLEAGFLATGFFAGAFLTTAFLACAFLTGAFFTGLEAFVTGFLAGLEAAF